MPTDNELLVKILEQLKELKEALVSPADPEKEDRPFRSVVKLERLQ